MSTEEMIIAALSIATAAAFWIVTQWNIVRTKNVLTKFQKEAREDANQKIETAFLEMDHKLSATRAEIESAITSNLSSIETPDIGAHLDTLRNDFASMLTQVRDDVTASLKGQMASFYAQEVRGLQKELKPLEGLVNAAGEEVATQLQENMTAGLTPAQLAFARLLATDVSEDYREANAGAAMLIDAGKAYLAQMAQQSGMLSPVRANTQNVRTSNNGGSRASSPYG